MFKIIIVIVIILMMMMTFKDQFLLPYTCNIRVLFLNKVFLNYNNNNNSNNNEKIINFIENFTINYLQE